MFNAAKSALLLVSKSKQPFKCVPEFYIRNQCTDLASEYVHLGVHIVFASMDDKNGILSKWNSLCGKISNIYNFIRHIGSHIMCCAAVFGNVTLLSSNLNYCACIVVTFMAACCGT